MDPPPPPSAGKTAMRSWAKSARAALDLTGLGEQIVGHLAEWEPLQEAETVLVYLPLPDEIDVSSLVERLPAARFVASRTPEVGDLTLHELGGPLEVHRYGFLQPHASAPRVESEELDVVLVPGLAFDLRGHRLGRGGGYYDRLLGSLRAQSMRVAVTPAALVVDHLPVDDHDVAVTHLASEEGVVDLR